MKLSENKTSEVRLDGVQFFSYDLGERLSEYRRRSGRDIDPYKKWFAFDRVSVKRPDGKYFTSRTLSFPIGLATLAFAFPLALGDVDGPLGILLPGYGINVGAGGQVRKRLVVGQQQVDISTHWQEVLLPIPVGVGIEGWAEVPVGP